MFLGRKIFIVCFLTVMNFETFCITFYYLGLNVKLKESIVISVLSPKTERIKNSKKLTLNQTFRTEFVQFQHTNLESYEFRTNALLCALSEAYLGQCHTPRGELFCENSKQLLTGNYFHRKLYRRGLTNS